jgi:hypothetical protein
MSYNVVKKMTQVPNNLPLQALIIKNYIPMFWNWGGGGVGDGLLIMNPVKPPKVKVMEEGPVEF